MRAFPLPALGPIRLDIAGEFTRFLRRVRLMKTRGDFEPSRNSATALSAKIDIAIDVVGAGNYRLQYDLARSPIGTVSLTPLSVDLTVLT